MGAIKEKPQAKIIDVPLENYVRNAESDGETGIEANYNNTVNSISHSKKKKQKPVWYIDAPIDDFQSKKYLGGRKTRKCENARLLYASVDATDICYDYSDMLPVYQSAFTDLFLDEQKMRAWNAFIDREEVEQLRFLESIIEEKKLAEKDNWKGHENANSANNMEARAHHPAYSSESSFSRMGRRLRNFFLQRSVPVDFVSMSERKLRNFFTDHVSCAPAVWSSLSLNPLERLIIHGIAQYLSLHSRSVTCDGKRMIKVRNKTITFKPPSRTLIDHLITLGVVDEKN